MATSIPIRYLCVSGNVLVYISAPSVRKTHALSISASSIPPDLVFHLPCSLRSLAWSPSSKSAYLPAVNHPIPRSEISGLHDKIPTT